MKINQLLKKLSKDGSIKQLRRYLIIGFSATAIDFVLFSFLGFFFKDINIYIKNSIGYTIGFLFSFLLNRNWAFESKDNWVRQVVLYFCLFAFNLYISNILVKYLAILLETYFFNQVFSELIAKAFSMGVIVIWNFIIYKKVIYVERKK